MQAAGGDQASGSTLLMIPLCSSSGAVQAG